jgi:hypothetical protein
MKTDTVKKWTLQFPISLALEGEDCFKHMADMGIQRSLFCNGIYSPYRLVLPRHPQKAIYSLEEGRYYHKPIPAKYSGLPLSPTPSQDFDGRDLLAESVAGAKKAGISPGIWLTLFANGSIAKQHPEWAVMNLYDSRDRLFLCFNNPEVREYSIRLGEEVVGNYDVDEVMLDKIPQTCLELNAFAGRIDPVMRTLGSFCFCPHCVAAAKKEGIDLLALKAQALKLSNAALKIPPYVTMSQAAELTGDAEIPLLLLDNPWILQVLKFRIDSIRSFLGQLKARLPRKEVPITLCFVPIAKIGHDSSSPRAWLAAQSYECYRDSAAEMIHSVVHWDADSVEYNTMRAMNAVEGSSLKVVTHVKAYGTTRPADIAGLSAAVKRAGADGIAYFCYDLMTNEIMDAIAKAGR